MNCPSRVDPIDMDGYNQNPNALNADATTRADLDHMANARRQRGHRIDPADGTVEIESSEQQNSEGDEKAYKLKADDGRGNVTVGDKGSGGPGAVGTLSDNPAGNTGRGGNNGHITFRGIHQKITRVLRRYAKFIGPGFMVAVAYIDPGKLLVSSLYGKSWQHVS
jgi:metal iron transporter